jgi:hypothetical protein
MDILCGVLVQHSKLVTGDSKERSVKCFYYVCWSWHLFRYMYINGFLNWEEWNMKLRSTLFSNEALRTTPLKREWFINMPTCVEPWTTRYRSRTGCCCNKHLRGERGREQFHNVVTTYTLFHEAKHFPKLVLCLLDLSNSCMLLGQFKNFTLSIGFHVQGRYGW